MAGACECVNEPSGSIKCGKFLDYLKTLGKTCSGEFSLVQFRTKQVSEQCLPILKNVCK